MRARHRLAVALLATSTVALALVSPATANAAPKVALPTCEVAGVENMSGFMFVNNQITNGTWTYSTGAACSANVADMELYEELDFNGVKVDSKLRGFTGSPQTIAVITSTFHCAACNGAWLFKWGEVLVAPAGVTFVTPPPGCVSEANGAYLLCAQTKKVTL